MVPRAYNKRGIIHVCTYTCVSIEQNINDVSTEECMVREAGQFEYFLLYVHVHVHVGIVQDIDDASTQESGKRTRLVLFKNFSYYYVHAHVHDRML